MNHLILDSPKIELLHSPDNLYESRLLEVFGQAVVLYWVDRDRVPENVLHELTELARLKNEESLTLLMKTKDKRQESEMFRQIDAIQEVVERERPRMLVEIRREESRIKTLQRFDTAVRAEYPVGTREYVTKAVSDLRCRLEELQDSDLDPRKNRSLFVTPRLDAQIAGVPSKVFEDVCDRLAGHDVFVKWRRYFCPNEDETFGEYPEDGMPSDEFCSHCGQLHILDELVYEEVLALKTSV